MTPRTSPAQFEAAAREAIEHMERVTRDPSAGIEIYFSLGRLYLRTGEAEKSIDALNKVLSQNPARCRGDCRYRRPTRRTTISIARSRRSRSSWTTSRGCIHARAVPGAGGAAEGAVESYTKALALEPTNRTLKFRRIAALFNARDFQRAATLAAEAQARMATTSAFLGCAPADLRRW